MARKRRSPPVPEDLPAPESAPEPDPAPLPEVEAPPPPAAPEVLPYVPKAALESEPAFVEESNPPRAWRHYAEWCHPDRVEARLAELDKEGGWELVAVIPWVRWVGDGESRGFYLFGRKQS
jgi:hypothetical protein